MAGRLKHRSSAQRDRQPAAIDKPYQFFVLVALLLPPVDGALLIYVSWIGLAVRPNQRSVIEASYV
jgi:hypothetical protein